MNAGIPEMSSVRNRGQSQRGPQVPSRVLSRDLLGAQDVLIAFDGYESKGPELQASVLQRPVQQDSSSLLQRFRDRARHLLAAVQRRFMR